VSIRDMTLGDVERLERATGDSEQTFVMDETTFRAFYDRTARPLWVYLYRMCGDAQRADDLLQEAYYRFLRAGSHPADDAHRRNYLYRIATNLVRDARRRVRGVEVELPADDAHDAPVSGGDVARQVSARTDLGRAMAHLTARERDLLWLAYAEGSSHGEIAESLGLKAGSIRMLLFRARRRLAWLLQRGESRGTAGGGRA
jgi:RNA polymerase sigma-70 factor (ECF subfamily)